MSDNTRKPWANPVGTNSCFLFSSEISTHKKFLNVFESTLKSTTISIILPSMTLTSLVWSFGGSW